MDSMDSGLEMELPPELEVDEHPTPASSVAPGGGGGGGSQRRSARSGGAGATSSMADSLLETARLDDLGEVALDDGADSSDEDERLARATAHIVLEEELLGDLPGDLLGLENSGSFAGSAGRGNTAPSVGGRSRTGSTGSEGAAFRY
eukprot:jgi/Tetstr1/442358/TSEL_003190.t1